MVMEILSFAPEGSEYELRDNHYEKECTRYLAVPTIDSEKQKSMYFESCKMRICNYRPLQTLANIGLDKAENELIEVVLS